MVCVCLVGGVRVCGRVLWAVMACASVLCVSVPASVLVRVCERVYLCLWLVGVSLWVCEYV